MENNNLTMVANFNDQLSDNACWCSTLNIAWNDFRKRYNKKNYILKEKNAFAEKLDMNCENIPHVDESEILTKAGMQVEKFKKRLEKEISKKFDEKSDVLNQIIWKKGCKSENWIFYTMYKAKFAFKKEFEIFENEYKFKRYDKAVKFLGCNKYCDGYKIFPKYYNNQNDFAVQLKTNDERKTIYVCRTDKDDSFKNIYDSMINSHNKEYTKIKSFAMPFLKFATQKDYTRQLGEYTLLRKKFSLIKPAFIKLNKMIQTLQFELNNKEAKAKSEAVISVRCGASVSCKMPEPKYYDFIFDDKFYLFLVEDHKPVLAVKVTDIENFI